MAVLASARERIVTKAVPRLIPVSASRETCMLKKKRGKRQSTFQGPGKSCNTQQKI